MDTRTFAAAQSHNHCGNATAINEDEFLKKIDTPGINYYSPILNSQQASDEFYKYLMDHDPQIKSLDDAGSARARIALLSEVGTGHGHLSLSALLPAWILLSKRDGEAHQTGWGRHWVIGVVACMILVFTLGAFIWLMVSFSRWMVGGWRHFHGRIWVLLALVAVVAMITLVGWGLFEVFFEFERPEQVFFFLRATELTSGVSVLLPALLIGLAAFLHSLPHCGDIIWPSACPACAIPGSGWAMRRNSCASITNGRNHSRG